MAEQRLQQIFYTTIHIKKLIQNSPPKADQPRAEKLKNFRKGFTLIELLVAMFIFAMVMGGMVAVSVAGFRSYQKSRIIKIVTEDVGFAVNSITKDVRMGKIELPNVAYNASASDKIMITRNASQAKVCYLMTRGTGSDYLAVNDSVSSAASSCPAYSSAYKKIVDLSGTGMAFASNSGFRNQKTDAVSATKVRGWAEINLNIDNSGMDVDSIHVQTTVSSRDYGWEEVP
jgi:prepilin-type N-terminal cleavage/methylation domain-containing protein